MGGGGGQKHRTPHEPYRAFLNLFSSLCFVLVLPLSFFLKQYLAIEKGGGVSAPPSCHTLLAGHSPPVEDGYRTLEGVRDGAPSQGRLYPSWLTPFGSCVREFPQYLSFIDFRAEDAISPSPPPPASLMDPLVCSS